MTPSSAAWYYNVVLYVSGALTTGIKSTERRELGLNILLRSITCKAAEIIAAEKNIAGQYGGRTRDIRVISTTL